ncbi:MAG: C2H2-type zinc finger protein [Haloarculaceae archaeon]
MTWECRYCHASFGDRDAYVRHLATAHEPNELSSIDARLVERYEAKPVFAEQRGRLRDALVGPSAFGSMRLPIGRRKLAQLSVLAVIATLAVAGGLAALTP